MKSMRIGVHEEYLSYLADEGFGHRYWNNLIKTIVNCVFYDYNITFIGMSDHDARYKKHHMLRSGSLDVFMPGSVLTRLPLDVSITHPYAYTYHHILSTVHVNNQVQRDFFITSLPFQVWFCIIASILILSIVMSFEKTSESSFPVRCLRNIFFTTSLLIQKSCVFPSSFGFLKRLTAGIWLLAVTVITSFYYGSLTTTSTLVRADPIDTMEDVTRHPHVKAIVPKYISVNANLIAKADVTFNSFLRQSNEKRTNRFFADPPTKTVKKLYQGRVVLFSTLRNILIYVVSSIERREKRSKLFYIGKREYFFSSVVLLTSPRMSKKTKYIINRRIRRSYETAQFTPYENLIANFIRGYVSEGKIGQFEYTAVQLRTLNNVYLVWFIGMLISLFSLIVECIWFTASLRKTPDDFKTAHLKYSYAGKSTM